MLDFLAAPAQLPRSVLFFEKSLFLYLRRVRECKTVAAAYRCSLWFCSLDSVSLLTQSFPAMTLVAASTTDKIVCPFMIFLTLTPSTTLDSAVAVAVAVSLLVLACRISNVHLLLLPLAGASTNANFNAAQLTHVGMARE